MAELTESERGLYEEMVRLRLYLATTRSVIRMMLSPANRHIDITYEHMRVLANLVLERGAHWETSHLIPGWSGRPRLFPFDQEVDELQQLVNDVADEHQRETDAIWAEAGLHPIYSRVC